MGMREDNPMVDSDLELIITTFERAMVKSRDADSVFVPFRRELRAFTNYPDSIVKAIDNLPLPAEEENAVSGATVSPAVAGVIGPDERGNDPLTASEDANDDGDDLSEKIKNWMLECAPCKGQVKRVISAADAEFFKDIGLEWERALDEVKSRFEDFENLFDETDITGAMCDLGSFLSGSCYPDIQKMIFIAENLLSKAEVELSLDLNIFDSFLMSALSPIFNELASNLDLIEELAINPIKCVIDYMQYQMANAPNVVERAKGAVIDPVRRTVYEQRARILAARRANARAEVSNEATTDSESEAARAAARQRLEQMHLSQMQQARSNYESALQRMNAAGERAKTELSFIAGFKQYLETGVQFVENKKQWLIGLIEEFVNGHFDRWGEHMQFAKSKTDILTYLSVMRAVIDAVDAGEFSCGSDVKVSRIGSGPKGKLTESNIVSLTRYWKHPAESLEVLTEGGNIVVRRRPGAPVKKLGVYTGGEGPDSKPSGKEITNVIARRPISSCLKKVTADEAEQVDAWIRQLEDEV